MRLAAEDAKITLWDNQQLKLPAEYLGLKGSATQVRRIFSPQREKGEIIGDGLNNPEDAANLLLSKLVEKDILAFESA